MQELLGFCAELGAVLHSAANAVVGAWSEAHVENAFGWASYVEHIVTHNVPDELIPELDRNLVELQDSLQDGQPAGAEQGRLMPPQTQLLLNARTLRGARHLMLQLLLQNHALPHSVARAALTQALSADGDSVGLVASLLPSVRLRAELQLLHRFGRSGDNEAEEKTANGPESTKADTLKTPGGGGGGGGGWITNEVAAAAMAVAAVAPPPPLPPAAVPDGQSSRKRLRPAEWVKPPAPGDDGRIPPCAAGLAHLLSLAGAQQPNGTQEAGGDGGDGGGGVVADVVAPNLRSLHDSLISGSHSNADDASHASNTLWALPAPVIAAACAVDDAVEQQGNGGALLGAYAHHLHGRMRALLADKAAAGDEAPCASDAAASGEIGLVSTSNDTLVRDWRRWSLRWAALLEQPRPCSYRAEALLNAAVRGGTSNGIAGLSAAERYRLRYLAQTADDEVQRQAAAVARVDGEGRRAAEVGAAASMKLRRLIEAAPP